MRGSWRTGENPRRYRTQVQARMCKVHISRRDLQSNQKPFYFWYSNGNFSLCRQYRHSTQNKRLGVSAKIRRIKEPSKRKAQGSSTSLHHEQTIQGQTLIQVAICLTIPADVKWNLWGPPALNDVCARLRKCDRCIFKMIFSVAVDWTFS